MGSFAATGVDYAIALVIVALYTIGAGLVSRPLAVRPLAAMSLMLACLALTLAKYVNSLTDGSDSLAYYLLSFGTVDLDFGSEIVVKVTGLFTRTLDLGFLPMSLIFGGVTGLSVIILWAAYLRASNEAAPLVETGVFVGLIVVSLGFWGGGISKESFAFLSIALLCWGLVRFGSPIVPIACAVLLMLPVRPHVAAAMVAGVGVAMPLAKGLPVQQRGPLIAASVIGLIILIPLVATFVGLGSDFALADVQGRLDEQSSIGQMRDGFVDIQGLSPPLRVLSYLARPLPWEAGSLTQLLAAGQNVLLLAVLALLIVQSRPGRSPVRRYNVLILLLFAAIAWVPLGLSTANLGIAQRQKWMFVPALLLALVWLRTWTRVIGSGTALVPVKRSRTLPLRREPGAG